jgi:NADH:ubiquinone oxidoreductase subunit 5 (subunit L)/multisubunit Na+/H+ antiporter MnhA subunit
LGIYLLSRISLDFFVLNNYACAMLLLIGSGTIIFAVFKALTQHDLRKLLSYHAISQVGYMVVGFGTANPLGIAGGIFHLLNNALYKSGLFLTIGAVGGQRQRFKIEELGGLAKYMPLTFICGLIFSLAISGVLPLNGFFSKWMLYQGALSGMSGAESIWLRLVFLFALVAAMFGSALTLASFIKFIHGLFLGQESEAANRPKEAPASMLLALGVLAGLCLILGVFPRAFLRIFILPVMPAGISFIGEWDSAGAYILLGAGLLAGAGFWLWMRSKKLLREDSCFTGAETVVAQAGFPATEFYRSIEELPATRALYRLLKIEALDLYNIIVGAANVLSYILFIFVDRLISMLTTTTGFLVLGLSWCFRRLHSGVLDLYLAWGLFGLGLLLFLLLR